MAGPGRRGGDDRQPPTRACWRRRRRARDREWLEGWTRADRAAAGRDRRDARRRAVRAARGRRAGRPPPARARRSWSPRRCRCATSRRSSRPARRPRACSRTAAPTGSTAPSRPRSGSPRPASPTVLLIGDVALAARHRRPARRSPPGSRPHDRRCSTTTAAASSTSSPSRGEGADFEEHVATPHGLDFARAAALYGLAHERVITPEAFRAALDSASGPTIIEVRTDRAENLELHRRVAQAVMQSVRGGT